MDEPNPRAWALEVIDRARATVWRLGEADAEILVHLAGPLADLDRVLKLPAVAEVSRR